MAIIMRQCAVLAVFIIAIGLHQDAEAVTHIVGGTTGWTFQATNPSFYDNWAQEQTFAVGDVLDFTYNAASHDAAEVTSAQLAACDSSSPIVLNTTSGGATLAITSTGTHAYICTLAEHCQNGMKMTIRVGPPISTTTSPPPSTPSASAEFKSLPFLSNMVIGVMSAAFAALYV